MRFNLLFMDEEGRDAVRKIILMDDSAKALKKLHKLGEVSAMDLLQALYQDFTLRGL